MFSFRLFLALTLLSSANAAYAGGCITSGQVERLAIWNDGTKLREIFPTLREASIPDGGWATLDIGREDCDAPDLEARRAKAEAMLGKRVRLVLSTADYSIVPRAPVMREILAIFPTAKMRGRKLDGTGEVLFVQHRDFSASDALDRTQQVAALIGSPVELREVP
ncbi:hypothetical protein [Xanthomonas campestris]|uniref:hypothetical protein n=1 Tax=Xanthomonas campestris TaxID=339 RepID=UPI002379F198|nr:hypothetical protein [Xanthomonas campestris]WDK04538.1 hypothetical protein JH273_21745 [Xanthomonas campestris]